MNDLLARRGRTAARDARRGRRGCRLAAGTALAVLSGVVTAAPAYAGAADPRYVLVGEWTSSDGRAVQLRQGDLTNGSGFGLAKLESHNLTARGARVITQHPDPGFPIKVNNAVDTWNYGATVAHVQCNGKSFVRVCTITEKVRVIVRVDFSKIDRAGNSKGVITGYCQGYHGECPAWVRNPVNG